MEPEILHEVPESLKKLVRLIVRGFYSIEHAIVLDMLVRNPCMKEEDMVELLKFEIKHLRSLMNTLKLDKFIKVRMRVETDVEGRTTRHNYYFINYKVFVNVVKYKLDHIRRKIEMEERDSTSRASFKCPSCLKTYTDLEAGQLLDHLSGLLHCMICQEEVEEDESAIPKQDARTMLAKFNEQIQPIYDLLKDCEDIRLAPEILDPEPVDMKLAVSKCHGNVHRSEKTVWSGELTKDVDFGYTENTVTITMDDKIGGKDQKKAKEQPVWMRESTVDGASRLLDKVDGMFMPSTSRQEQTSKMETSEDIMRTLLVHEKKTASVPAGGGSDDASSTDSEEEVTKPSTSADVEEMESEDEEESIPMVSIGDTRVPLHEVTDMMVSQMTTVEKEAYIRLGQEMYQDLYE